MFKKKSRVMLAALAAMMVCQTIPAIAGAAPDGKTPAESTAAAANGAYDAWKEEWAKDGADWTQVSLTPGADETQMNFAWYSKDGEAAGFRFGKQKDLADAKDVEVSSVPAQAGYQSNMAKNRNFDRRCTPLEKTAPPTAHLHPHLEHFPSKKAPSPQVKCSMAGCRFSFIGQFPLRF